MNAPIASMMKLDVTAVDMDDTIADVEKLFARKDLSWAPVLEAQRNVVGVISASDLLQFRALERDAAATRAWQLCSYRPLCVAPDAPLDEVARQMVERGVHHVVVMNGRGRIAGVVSSLDFVRTFCA